MFNKYSIKRRCNKIAICNIKLHIINLLSLRYCPSAAGLLGPRPRFRVVHRLRRVAFDKRHNGAEAATHPAYI